MKELIEEMGFCTLAVAGVLLFVAYQLQRIADSLATLAKKVPTP